MAGFEALLLFLVVPTCASVFAILAGLLAYSNLQARDDSENPGPQSLGRFIVYPAIVTTPVVFGVVLFFLSNQLTPILDSGSGITSRAVANLVVWSAASFAVVVSVALAAQAWVARVRMAQFVGADFGRVEPLIVLPETAIVLALVIAFLVLGRAGYILDGTVIFPPAAIDSVVLALQAFSVSSFTLLFGVLLSNQVENLAGPGFLRALIRGEIGTVAVIATFIWAFLQLRNF